MGIVGSLFGKKNKAPEVQQIAPAATDVSGPGQENTEASAIRKKRRASGYEDTILSDRNTLAAVNQAVTGLKRTLG